MRIFHQTFQPHKLRLEMMLERPEHSDSGRDAVIRYELNNDFEASTMSANEIQALVVAWQSAARAGASRLDSASLPPHRAPHQMREEHSNFRCHQNPAIRPPTNTVFLTPNPC